MCWRHKVSTPGTSGLPMWRISCTNLSCAWGRVQAGRLVSMRQMVDAAGWPTCLLPVVEKMEVSDSTRCGACAATFWAIMPPMDMPSTCACSAPRWSSRAITSLAMSLIR